MRAWVLGMAVLAAGCSGQDSKEAVKPEAPKLVLVVTPLELNAKDALEKRSRDKRAAEALEKRVKAAMEVVLIDPFSARYRTLRYGRGGAICGQVNGKNRLAGYVGFRDFVIGKDGKTVWMSEYSNGIDSELYGGFAEAYLNACASKSEAARHKVATEYDYGYDATAAAAAADAAAGGY